MFSPIWGKGNGRGISGFAVNRGAVNRGFTVLRLAEKTSCQELRSRQMYHPGLTNITSIFRLSF